MSAYSPCLVGCRRLGTALKIAGLATDAECGPSVGTDQVCPGPGEGDQAPGMEPACLSGLCQSRSDRSWRPKPNVSMYYADAVLNIRLTTRSLGRADLAGRWRLVSDPHHGSQVHQDGARPLASRPQLSCEEYKQEQEGN